MIKNGNFLERTMLSLQLQGEALPGVPLVEIIGKQRVLIENHNGVNCYTDREVLVNTIIGNIQIYGAKLSLNIMTKDTLVITGKIDSVAFC